MAKNIVVCCDGTDNEVATDSTNLLRLFRMLERDDRQVAYYDAGVGTLADPAAISIFRKLVSRRLDAAIGLRVRDNVIAAYRFLARTYLPGDRIFLFGFSRGAYTVRAVAGLIHFLGLARPELENLAALAWAVYANEAHVYTTSIRFAGGNRFNRCFGIADKPNIHFVGAWDTVSSFGWFWNYQTLPHTVDNPSITHIRHALAIDERRAFFPINFFRPQKPQQLNCKQVWFAGVHADVGGGYPEREATLAKVSLVWMLREAVELGLIINTEQYNYLLNSKNKPPADTCGPIHESLYGWWKPMEYLPRRDWDSTVGRLRWYGPHFGRLRLIQPYTDMNVAVLHASVLERRDRQGYWPVNLPKVYEVER